MPAAESQPGDAFHSGGDGHRAWTAPADRVRGLEAGADDFLDKNRYRTWC